MSWNGVKQTINIEGIKFWCDEMEIENYTINSKGEIDVDGGVYLIHNNFKELPYKFGRVCGFFDMGNNPNLISLKNCPDQVGDYFSCNYCSKLDSLEGCPKEVGKGFYCRGCKQKFAKEEIISLCKVKKDIIV